MSRRWQALVPMSTPDLKPNLSLSQPGIQTNGDDHCDCFHGFQWGGVEDFENHSEYHSFKDDDLHDPNLWCERKERDSSEKFVGRQEISRWAHYTCSC